MRSACSGADCTLLLWITKVQNIRRIVCSGIEIGISVVDWEGRFVDGEEGQCDGCYIISCDNLFLVNNKSPILQYSREFLIEIDLFALTVNTRDGLHILLS